MILNYSLHYLEFAKSRFVVFTLFALLVTHVTFHGAIFAPIDARASFTLYGKTADQESRIITLKTRQNLE